MSTKKKGMLTVSGEWAKHLRPYGRRQFWGSERMMEKVTIFSEVAALQGENHEASQARKGWVEYCESSEYATQEEMLEWLGRLAEGKREAIPGNRDTTAETIRE